MEAEAEVGGATGRKARDMNDVDELTADHDVTECGHFAARVTFSHCCLLGDRPSPSKRCNNHSLHDGIFRHKDFQVDSSNINVRAYNKVRILGSLLILRQDHCSIVRFSGRLQFSLQRGRRIIF